MLLSEASIVRIRTHLGVRPKDPKGLSCGFDCLPGVVILKMGAPWISDHSARPGNEDSGHKDEAAVRMSSAVRRRHRALQLYTSALKFA